MAAVPVAKKLHLLAGFQHGRDHIATGGTFNSRGVFAEGDVPINQYATAGVRYDRFHSNTAKLNRQWAVTPYISIPLQNGFQIIAEYQHRDFQLDAINNRQNDTFQVRVIFIQ